MTNTEEIWKEFSKQLLTFIRDRVQNPYDAEDILQEVFRKIHHQLNTLNDEQKLASWIYQITRNTIIDYYRSKSKLKETALALTEDDLVFRGAEENINEEVACWLKNMAMDLPEKYRYAIVLTELGNFTHKELAEKMGISLSGAKSRVQRGREKLREMVFRCCHLQFDGVGNVIGYQSKVSASCSCENKYNG